MSVARVTEISATSKKGFQDAIQVGLSRADKTLRGIKGAWVKEQKVTYKSGAIDEFCVNILVTFELDD